MPAGGHPCARAESAVVGPTATSEGRPAGGQARASSTATLGLATTSTVARAAARLASSSPARSER
jgi:hypothetical protein